MNILPKKKWHVKRRENIERVKADEAKAAAEENVRLQRSQLAEQEARTAYLRGKKGTSATGSKLVGSDSGNRDNALELFRDVEDGRNVNSTNREYEEEKKKETETAEKAIGLLTYLGQTVLDSQGKAPWYTKTEKQPAPADNEEEWHRNKKLRLDPLFMMRQAQQEINRKKRESSLKDIIAPRLTDVQKLPVRLADDIRIPAAVAASNTSETSRAVVASSCGKTIDQLRAERLAREQKERLRESGVLLRVHCPDVLQKAEEAAQSTVDERSIPYNSAFNPELAMVMAMKRAKRKERRSF